MREKLVRSFCHRSKKELMFAPHGRLMSMLGPHVIETLDHMALKAN